MPRPKSKTKDERREDTRMRVRKLREDPEYYAKERALDKVRQKERRDKMTDEQRARYRASARERGRKKRMEIKLLKEQMGELPRPRKSNEVTPDFRVKDAQRKREFRQSLTDEQRVKLRARDAERKRLKRAEKKRQAQIAKGLLNNATWSKNQTLKQEETEISFHLDERSNHEHDPISITTAETVHENPDKSRRRKRDEVKKTLDGKKEAGEAIEDTSVKRSRQKSKKRRKKSTHGSGDEHPTHIKPEITSTPKGTNKSEGCDQKVYLEIETHTKHAPHLSLLPAREEQTTDTSSAAEFIAKVMREISRSPDIESETRDVEEEMNQDERQLNMDIERRWSEFESTSTLEVTKIISKESLENNPESATSNAVVEVVIASQIYLANDTPASLHVGQIIPLNIRQSPNESTDKKMQDLNAKGSNTLEKENILSNLDLENGIGKTMSGAGDKNFQGPQILAKMLPLSIDGPVLSDESVKATNSVSVPLHLSTEVTEDEPSSQTEESLQDRSFAEFDVTPRMILELSIGTAGDDKSTHPADAETLPHTQRSSKGPTRSDEVIVHACPGSHDECETEVDMEFIPVTESPLHRLLRTKAMVKQLPESSLKFELLEAEDDLRSEADVEVKGETNDELETEHLEGSDDETDTETEDRLESETESEAKASLNPLESSQKFSSINKITAVLPETTVPEVPIEEYEDESETTVLLGFDTSFQPFVRTGNYSSVEDSPSESVEGEVRDFENVLEAVESAIDMEPAVRQIKIWRPIETEDDTFVIPTTSCVKTSVKNKVPNDLLETTTTTSNTFSVSDNQSESYIGQDQLAVIIVPTEAPMVNTTQSSRTEFPATPVKEQFVEAIVQSESITVANVPPETTLDNEKETPKITKETLRIATGPQIKYENVLETSKTLTTPLTIHFEGKSDVCTSKGMQLTAAQPWKAPAGLAYWDDPPKTIGNHINAKLISSPTPEKSVHQPQAEELAATFVPKVFSTSSSHQAELHPEPTKVVALSSKDSLTGNRTVWSSQEKPSFAATVSVVIASVVEEHVASVNSDTSQSSPVVLPLRETPASPKASEIECAPTYSGKDSQAINLTRKEIEDFDDADALISLKITTLQATKDFEAFQEPDGLLNTDAPCKKGDALISSNINVSLPEIECVSPSSLTVCDKMNLAGELTDCVKPAALTSSDEHGSLREIMPKAVACDLERSALGLEPDISTSLGVNNHLPETENVPTSSVTLCDVIPAIAEERDYSKEFDIEGSRKEEIEGNKISSATICAGIPRVAEELGLSKAPDVRLLLPETESSPISSIAICDIPSATIDGTFVSKGPDGLTFSDTDVFSSMIKAAPTSTVAACYIKHVASEELGAAIGADVFLSEIEGAPSSSVLGAFKKPDALTSSYAEVFLPDTEGAPNLLAIVGDVIHADTNELDVSKDSDASRASDADTSLLEAGGAPTSLVAVCDILPADAVEDLSNKSEIFTLPDVNIFSTKSECAPISSAAVCDLKRAASDASKDSDALTSSDASVSFLKAEGASTSLVAVCDIIPAAAEELDHLNECEVSTSLDVNIRLPETEDVTTSSIANCDLIPAATDELVVSKYPDFTSFGVEGSLSETESASFSLAAVCDVIPVPEQSILARESQQQASEETTNMPTAFTRAEAPLKFLCKKLRVLVKRLKLPIQKKSGENYVSEITVDLLKSSRSGATTKKRGRPPKKRSQRKAAKKEPKVARTTTKGKRRRADKGKLYLVTSTADPIQVTDERVIVTKYSPESHQYMGKHRKEGKIKTVTSTEFQEVASATPEMWSSVLNYTSVDAESAKYVQRQSRKGSFTASVPNIANNNTTKEFTSVPVQTIKETRVMIVTESSLKQKIDEKRRKVDPIPISTSCGKDQIVATPTVSPKNPVTFENQSEIFKPVDEQFAATTLFEYLSNDLQTSYTKSETPAAHDVVAVLATAEPPANKMLSSEITADALNISKISATGEKSVALSETKEHSLVVQTNQTEAAILCASAESLLFKNLQKRKMAGKEQYSSSLTASAEADKQPERLSTARLPDPVHHSIQMQTISTENSTLVPFSATVKEEPLEINEHNINQKSNPIMATVSEKIVKKIPGILKKIEAGAASKAKPKVQLKQIRKKIVNLKTGEVKVLFVPSNRNVSVQNSIANSPKSIRVDKMIRILPTCKVNVTNNEQSSTGKSPLIKMELTEEQSDTSPLVNIPEDVVVKLEPVDQSNTRPRNNFADKSISKMSSIGRPKLYSKPKPLAVANKSKPSAALVCKSNSLAEIGTKNVATSQAKLTPAHSRVTSIRKPTARSKPCRQISVESKSLAENSLKTTVCSPKTTSTKTTLSHKLNLNNNDFKLKESLAIETSSRDSSTLIKIELTEEQSDALQQVNVPENVVVKLEPVARNDTMPKNNVAARRIPKISSVDKPKVHAKPNYMQAQKSQANLTTAHSKNTSIRKPASRPETIREISPKSESAAENLLKAVIRSPIIAPTKTTLIQHKLYSTLKPKETPPYKNSQKFVSRTTPTPTRKVLIRRKIIRKLVSKAGSSVNSELTNYIGESELTNDKTQKSTLQMKIIKPLNKNTEYTQTTIKSAKTSGSQFQIKTNVPTEISYNTAKIAAEADITIKPLVKRKILKRIIRRKRESTNDLKLKASSKITKGEPKIQAPVKAISNNEIGKIPKVVTTPQKSKSNSDFNLKTTSTASTPKRPRLIFKKATAPKQSEAKMPTPHIYAEDLTAKVVLTPTTSVETPIKIKSTPRTPSKIFGTNNAVNNAPVKCDIKKVLSAQESESTKTTIHGSLEIITMKEQLPNGKWITKKITRIRKPQMKLRDVLKRKTIGATISAGDPLPKAPKLATETSTNASPNGQKQLSKINVEHNRSESQMPKTGTKQQPAKSNLKNRDVGSSSTADESLFSKEPRMTESNINSCKTITKETLMQLQKTTRGLQLTQNSCTTGKIRKVRKIIKRVKKPNITEQQSLGIVKLANIEKSPQASEMISITKSIVPAAKIATKKPVQSAESKTMQVTKPAIPALKEVFRNSAEHQKYDNIASRSATSIVKNVQQKFTQAKEEVKTSQVLKSTSPINKKIVQTTTMKMVDTTASMLNKETRITDQQTPTGKRRVKKIIKIKRPKPEGSTVLKMEGMEPLQKKSKLLTVTDSNTGLRIKCTQPSTKLEASAEIEYSHASTSELKQSAPQANPGISKHHRTSKSE